MVEIGEKAEMKEKTVKYDMCRFKYSNVFVNFKYKVKMTEKVTTEAVTKINGKKKGKRVCITN